MPGTSRLFCKMTNVNSFSLLVKPLSEPTYNSIYELEFQAEIIQQGIDRSNGPVYITVRADKYQFPKDKFALPKTNKLLPTWGYRVTGDLHLDYSHIIVGAKPVRRGSDELTLTATSITEVCQLPDWQNHPLANLIVGYDSDTYNNYANSCSGNAGQVYSTQYDNVENRSIALTRNCESDTRTPLWVTGAFWGDKAELCRNLIPARARLSISGPILFKNWTDKPDGYDRVKVTVKVARFKIIPKIEDVA
jgi:hypothetical protein